jgi:hypothetical protein
MVNTTDAPASSHVAAANNNLKHKRRFCRIDGCERIVKSQGLCQRHGASPRKCKVDGCDKQAQGNFDRMCKSHFKAMKRAMTPLPEPPADDQALPPPPTGRSVYDDILPASIRFVPTYQTPSDEAGNGKSKKNPKPKEVMPLIAHLKAGFDVQKPPAWHRNEERRCRGMFPIHNPATQLEGWERELVWMEILILTGAPGASFRHLARAWGRDKGFHMVLAQFICERQGDVERKKRQGIEAAAHSDDAKQKARSAKGASVADAGSTNLKRSASATRPPPGSGARRKMARKGRSTSVSSSTSEGGNVISVDVWDDSVYNHADYNEALAADIFNFADKEVDSLSRRMAAAAAARKARGEVDSDDESDTGPDTKTAAKERPKGDQQKQKAPSEDPKIAGLERQDPPKGSTATQPLEPQQKDENTQVETSPTLQAAQAQLQPAPENMSHGNPDGTEYHSLQQHVTSGQLAPDQEHGFTAFFPTQLPGVTGHPEQVLNQLSQLAQLAVESDSQQQQEDHPQITPI